MVESKLLINSCVCTHWKEKLNIEQEQKMGYSPEIMGVKFPPGLKVVKDFLGGGDYSMSIHVCSSQVQND